MKKNPKFRVKINQIDHMHYFSIQIKCGIFQDWKSLEKIYINDSRFEESFEERQKQALTALVKWKTRYKNLIKEDIFYD